MLEDDTCMLGLQGNHTQGLDFTDGLALTGSQ